MIKDEQDLKQSDLEVLINSTDDLMWSVTGDFKLITCNKAFIDRIKNAAGIIVRPGDNLLLNNIFPEDFLSIWEEGYRRTLSGESFKKEIYTPVFNKSKESWLEISFNPVYKDGTAIAIACCSRDITERKSAAEKTRQSEERLAEAQAVAKVGSWETNLSNLEVIWSDETRRIFGISNGDATTSHQNFLQFVHPDDKEKVDAAFIDSLNKNMANAIEHRIITIDGTVKIVEERWHILNDSNSQPSRAIGTIQDITERKKAEELVKESEQRYRTLFEQNLAGFYRSGPDGVIINCNDAFAKMLKYDSANDLININASELYFSSEERMEFINNVISKNKLYNYEGVLKCKDGTALYYLENVSVHTNPQTGIEFFDGILIDITERTLAEEKVGLSEQRFKALVQNSSDLLAILNAEGLYTYVSPTSKNILGYDPDYFIGKSPFEFIHEDDLQKSTAALASLATERFVIAPLFRFRHSSGQWRWIESTLTNMINDPAVGGIVANSKDVTERKIIGDEIEKLSMVAKETINGVIIIDNDQNVIWINSAFTKMSGYELNDVKGRNPLHFFNGPETSQETVEYVKKQLRKKAPFVFEKINYKKNGEEIFMRVQMQPILDTHGEVKQLFGLITDITKQKKLEEIAEREKFAKQREITEAVFDAQEKERLEIGRELHDNVNQLLGAIRLYIDMARKDEEGRDALLKNASMFSLNAIEEIRKLSKTLIAPLTKEIGLMHSINDLADEIMLVHPIKISIASNNFKEDKLNDKFKLNLFRIIQEQINNILKHAKASNVTLRIDEHDNNVSICIADDGTGFDTTAQRNGVGITNIKSRSGLFNGHVILNSKLGSGTTLNIIFKKSDLMLTGDKLRSEVQQ